MLRQKFIDNSLNLDSLKNSIRPNGFSFWSGLKPMEEADFPGSDTTSNASFSSEDAVIDVVPIWTLPSGRTLS